MQYRCERSVSRPRPEVFAAFTDLEAAPDRIEGIDKIELLTDGPMQIGTQFRETRTMFGKEAVETMTVTEFDRDEKYVTRAESCGSLYKATYRFEEISDGTRVEFSFDATPQSFFAKLATPVMGLLMGRMMKRMIAKDLDDLIAAIEKSRGLGESR